MPAIPLVWLAAGALGGFLAGRGAEGAGNLVKWAVIGGVAYGVYKVAKG